jgi:WD40 repeat protein
MEMQSQPNSETSVIKDAYVAPQCSHLSADGRRLVVASGKWKVFDLATGHGGIHSRTGNVPGFGGAWAVRFSPDGSLLAIGGNFNFLWVLDAKTGKLLWDLTNEGHTSVIDHLYFTPDSKRLVSVASNEKRIRLWDVKNKQAEAVFHFTGIGTSATGPKLKNYVEKAKHVYEFERNERHIHQCAFTPDGKTLAVTVYNGKVSFLQLDTGKITSTISIKQAAAVALNMTPDGKWLLVSGCRDDGKDGRVEIWDLGTKKLVSIIAKHERAILRLAISPDKRSLITASTLSSSDGVRVWDVPTGKMKYHYFGKGAPCFPKIRAFEDGSKSVENEVGCAGCRFLPDGKTFYIVPAWRFGTEVHFYDTATGHPVDYRARVKALPHAKVNIRK